MRALAFGLTLFVSSHAMAQDAPDVPTLVNELNSSLGTRELTATTTPALGVVEIPQWGVVVKDLAGKALDVFGQVPYQVTKTGDVVVPGYTPPPGTKLEVIPRGEWSVVAQATTSADDLGSDYAPITAIPDAVEKATDYLANRLCKIKGRPTEISLSLVVGASGNVFFAEASTEAGSVVMWNLPTDICPRYGFNPKNP